MKIRLLAIAALGLLLGMTACGSEARDATLSSASADSPSTTTPAPSTTTSTASGVVDPTPTTSASPPTTGHLTPATVPAQTLTTLPRDSFLVTYGGARYYCEPQGYDDDESDCVRYYGGSAPYVGSPELYCSDSYSPECSEDWYPAALKYADMVTMGGQTYVCRRARLGGTVGDKECARYSGGDPDQVSYTRALKCTPEPGGLQCDDEYFPSEWEGLTQVQIRYDDYVCKSTFRGQECWEWMGYGSPKSATFGMPDLYCNSSAGTCDEGGYPSRY